MFGAVGFDEDDAVGDGPGGAGGFLLSGGPDGGGGRLCIMGSLRTWKGKIGSNKVAFVLFCVEIGRNPPKAKAHKQEILLYVFRAGGVIGCLCSIKSVGRTPV